MRRQAPVQEQLNQEPLACDSALPEEGPSQEAI